jgi:hypothetical protein
MTTWISTKIGDTGCSISVAIQIQSTSMKKVELFWNIYNWLFIRKDFGTSRTSTAWQFKKQGDFWKSIAKIDIPPSFTFSSDIFIFYYGWTTKSYWKSLFSHSKFPKKFSGNFRSSLDNVFDTFELTSAMTVIDKLIKYINVKSRQYEPTKPYNYIIGPRSISLKVKSCANGFTF